MVLVQILICNYFRFSAYIMLSILPVIILCLPTKIGTGPAMLIAFATGMAVDFLSEGMIGINTLSLVPVAFIRKSIINLIFGNELFERKDNISIRKFGYGKVSFAILVVQSLFLLIYIYSDGAGMRTFLFNAIRFSLSLLSGYLLSLLIVDIIASDDRK
jgi:cell shape-determining protein MreD